MDGVVLCHLANHIHPSSVAGIHVPSPAVVGLSLFVLTMKASLILQFFHVTALFPAQARHGQVSAKCGELPGGLQENRGTRGKTTPPCCISVFPQFEFLLGTGGLFLLSAFTSDIHRSERLGILWAANAAILHLIKLLVKAKGSTEKCYYSHRYLSHKKTLHAFVVLCLSAPLFLFFFWLWCVQGQQSFLNQSLLPVGFCFLHHERSQQYVWSVKRCFVWQYCEYLLMRNTEVIELTL